MKRAPVQVRITARGCGSSVRRLLWVLAGLCLVSGVAAYGHPFLTIGRKHTVVTETIHARLNRGTNVIELLLPSEADVSSLIVRRRRGGVDLWDVLPAAGPPESDAVADIRGSRILFRRAGEQYGTVPAGIAKMNRGVRCVLDSALAGDTRLEVIYVMTGLHWQADYRITVRGDWEKDPAHLSADLLGQVLVSNASHRTFEKAEVWITDEGGCSPQKHPGFLMIEPGPLARPWNASLHRRLPSPGRYLGGGLTIKAGALQVFPVLAARRIPAAVLYRLVTGPAVPGSLGRAVKAESFLVIRDLARRGVRLPLPPGRVILCRGVPGAPPLARGAFQAGIGTDEFRMRLGDEPAVTATKQEVGREESEPGRLKISCRIRIRNNADHEAAVEVVDTPADTGWEMFSYAHPYTRDGNLAIFQLKIPARGEKVIRYTILTERPVPALPRR